MSIIILIPALLCATALYFWTPARVLRDVVLPCLLLLPLYYDWKVALLPPLDFAETALLPLGIAMLLRCMRRWRYTWTDLWLVLFVLSNAVALKLQGDTTSSIFALFLGVTKIIFPYMAGKLLIEQVDARAATLGRIATLMAAAMVVGLFELKGLKNPFHLVFYPFFKAHEDVWPPQVRNGLGRITGPYADAELAGIVLMFGFLLTLYLARTYNWGPRFSSATALYFRKSTYVSALLLIALFLTQSRGPELGLIFAVPIALVGRSRDTLKASLIAFALVFVVGGAAYVTLSHYVSTNAPTSDQQETAAYRAVMIQDYLPMAEHSGLWGLGPRFHVIGKYASIDNEYLLVALTQGYIGFASLLLLIGSTVWTMLTAAIYNPERPDRAFAFTLLGIFVGTLVTIATVYLDYQALIFFFLMMGWAQALRVYPVRDSRPVFQQVYT